jgi:hypothetical protein
MKYIFLNILFCMRGSSAFVKLFMNVKGSELMVPLIKKPVEYGPRRKLEVLSVIDEGIDIYSMRSIIPNPTCEHVVPQSFIDESGGKKDLHNIFLLNRYMNSVRSNFQFRDISKYIIISDDIEIIDPVAKKTTKRTPFVGIDYCMRHVKFRYFVPLEDHSRGIIARACAYMLCTYRLSNPETKSISDSPMDLKENLRCGVIDPQTMCEWNDTYPPADREKRRNDKVYNIQHNYNVFIDDSTIMFDIFSPR